MPRVIIIEPDITPEENEINLSKVRESLQAIADELMNNEAEI